MRTRHFHHSIQWTHQSPGICTRTCIIHVCKMQEIYFVSSSMHVMERTFTHLYPDNKVHGANIGPNWVLSAPVGPYAGPMNLAIRVYILNMSERNDRVVCTAAYVTCLSSDIQIETSISGGRCQDHMHANLAQGLGHDFYGSCLFHHFERGYLVNTR